MTGHGVEIAYRLARERFADADHQAICDRSGGRLAPGVGVAVSLLGVERTATFPDGKVVTVGGVDEQARLGCLILRYLLQADGAPLRGEYVDFRALPGGAFYFGPYSGRSIGRLAREFGRDPSRLRAASIALGARQVEGEGDVAFELEGFPRVPLKVVLWGGDEEFGPSASILFDASVTGYLDAEGAAVISEVLVSELIARGKEII